MEENNNKTVSYKKLFKLLIDKDLKKQSLLKKLKLVKIRWRKWQVDNMFRWKF